MSLALLINLQLFQARCVPKSLIALPVLISYVMLWYSHYLPAQNDCRKPRTSIHCDIDSWFGSSRERPCYKL